MGYKKCFGPCSTSSLHRPPVNAITIFSDASVSGGAAFVAPVACNTEGKALAIQMSKKIIDVPEVAEAFAILKVIYLAIEESWRNICCINDASKPE